MTLRRTASLIRKTIIEAAPVDVKVSVGVRQDFPPGVDGGEDWPKGMGGKTDGDRQ